MSERRTTYKAGSKARRSKRGKPSIRRGTQDFVDFSKLPAFGIWADRTETDEELLDLMKSGWGKAPEDE
jgi:hypothetical protein